MKQQIIDKKLAIKKKECQITNKERHIAWYKKELEELTVLEEKYRVFTSSVFLEFKGKTIEFPWNLPSGVTITGKINLVPASRVYGRNMGSYPQPIINKDIYNNTSTIRMSSTRWSY